MHESLHTVRITTAGFSTSSDSVNHWVNIIVLSQKIVINFLFNIISYGMDDNSRRDDDSDDNEYKSDESTD